MFKSGSTRLIRNLNQQHILNLVRMFPGITGREISNQTGLQISTVLYTLKTLQKKGLIRSAGFGPTTTVGGKPPLKWRLNPEYGFILGIELLSREARLVLLDFDQRLIASHIQTLPDGLSAKQVIRIIRQMIDEQLQSQRIALNSVLGVGIGIPGTVDSEQGIIEYAPAFPFIKLPFKNLLSKYIPLPIHIENDANAGALGCKWLDPEEQMSENFIYLTIQQKFSGMGVGFIIHHELYRGAHGASGEIANFLSPGRWQKILAEVSSELGSGNRLLHKLEAFRTGRLPLSFLTNLAREGEAAAQTLLALIGAEIGSQIVHLIDLIDPQKIIIGGDLCEAAQFLKPAIQSKIAKEVISQSAREIPVKFSSFAALSGAYGGSALVLRKIFRQF